jgi:ABC-2 type transport system permease protein
MTELRQAWRISRTSALYELLLPGRLAGAGAQLALQIFLTWCLWRALYETVAVTGGLDRGQAVTYAVLATVYGRLQGPDRALARDTVRQHIHFGSIVYWYLRPVTPRRYHWLRAAGDQAYGLAWAVTAYAVCRLLGLAGPPASAPAVALFLLTLLLGQVVLYYLLALVDVACFWTLRNFGVLAIIRLAQSLFAGAIVPLWFFPGWFQAISSWLPFESSLHIPLSLYVGRIAPADAGRYVLVQVVWIVLLAVALRLFWRRADQQVVVQGG